MGLEEWYFGYLKNAFIPRYLLTLYRVHRVYHISFYSHFVQNKQSFITKKYSLYIVGEVRGKEALELLNSYNTGHDGGMSSGHGNSPKDMLARLETMVLMGADLPLAAIRSQIASALDILIHLGRIQDKSRKVLWIVEVDDYAEGEIRLRTLYRFEDGGLKKKEQLKNREKLQRSGEST